MTLELDPQREQLVGGRLQLPDDRRRDEPERDHRGARAEPALARDPVDEAEAPAVGRGEAREGADAEVRAIGGLVAGIARPSTSSSFHRSSAAPAQSKPGPMFAVVAGARTRTTVIEPPRSASGSWVDGRCAGLRRAAVSGPSARGR